MPVRRLLSGALTAPLLILSACGGSPSVADPPVSPSAPSSSASPPRHETPEAFIRRWADADIAMQNSGNSSVFRELSRRCKDCLALANRVDRIYEGGGYIRTRGWSIRQIEVVSSDDGRLVMNLSVRSFPTRYQESSRGPRRAYPGGPAVYQLGLTRFAKTWSVVSLARLSS